MLMSYTKALFYCQNVHSGFTVYLETNWSRDVSTYKVSFHMLRIWNCSYYDVSLTG